jgi:hypothetical protein
MTSGSGIEVRLGGGKWYQAGLLPLLLATKGFGPIVDRVWAFVKKLRERKGKVERKGFEPRFY